MFLFLTLSCALANLSAAIWNGWDASCGAPSYCARAMESLAPRISAVGGGGEEHAARMTTKAKAPVVPSWHSIRRDVMFNLPLARGYTLNSHALEFDPRECAFRSDATNLQPIRYPGAARFAGEKNLTSPAHAPSGRRSAKT
jgi:hypothetical protein